MAYAIAHIILGIDLGHSSYDRTPDPFAKFREELEGHINGVYDEKTQVYSQPTLGFGSSYSGSGDAPEWFGVSLGTFDECRSMLGAKLVQKLSPSAEHQQQYARFLDELRANPNVSNELKALLEKTEPHVFITWGTS